MKEQLDKIENKIDRLDEKITSHLERIAVVEEREKTDRGSIVLLFSILMTVIGWIVYKLKFTL